MMLPRERLGAGATEAAEGVVRFGADWGGYAECDAETDQQSREKSEAPAHGGICGHKHSSAE